MNLDDFDSYQYAFGGGGSSRGHAGAVEDSGYIRNDLLKNEVNILL